MADGKPKFDVVVLVLVIGVMVGGFWMVGSSAGDKMETIETRISHVHEGVQGIAMQVADLQNEMNAIKASAKAAAAAPAAAPAAASAPTAAAAAPAKKK